MAKILTTEGLNTPNPDNVVVEKILTTAGWNARAPENIVVAYWKDCGHCKASRARNDVQALDTARLKSAHLGKVRVYEADYVDVPHALTNAGVKMYPSVLLSRPGSAPMIVNHRGQSAGFEINTVVQAAKKYFGPMADADVMDLEGGVKRHGGRKVAARSRSRSRSAAAAKGRSPAAKAKAQAKAKASKAAPRVAEVIVVVEGGAAEASAGGLEGGEVAEIAGGAGKRARARSSSSTSSRSRSRAHAHAHHTKGTKHHAKKGVKGTKRARKGTKKARGLKGGAESCSDSDSDSGSESSDSYESDESDESGGLAGGLAGGHAGGHASRGASPKPHHHAAAAAAAADKPKRKPSAWVQHTKHFYEAMHKRDPSYSYKQAMTDARATYKQ